MALRENPELCQSYVRESCRLRPIWATQKPSLVAPLEEQEPLTEDPNTFEGHIVFTTHFISQSPPDICWKLQKLAMGPQTPPNLLIDTAFSVFNNKDQAEEEKKEQHDFRRERQQARLLAAIMRRPNPLPGHPKSTPRRPPPGKGASFSCGSPGHWSKECSGNRSQPAPKTLCPLGKKMGHWKRESHQL